METAPKKSSVKSAIWKTMNEQTSISGLFKTMPYAPFEYISAFLLCALASIPLFTALLSHQESYWLMRNIAVHGAFQVVGYVGLVFGCMFFLWRHFNRPAAKLGFRQWLRCNGLIVFLGAMLLWSVLSTVFSTDPALSFKGTEYRRDGLSSYFGYAGVFCLGLALRDRRKQRVVLGVFSTCAAVIAFLCLLNIPEVNAYCHINLDIGIFNNQNHYAYYLCMAFMSVVLLLATEGKRKTKFLTAFFAVIWLVELVLICHGLVMSKTLGTLIAVLFSLSAMLVLTIFIDKRRIRRISAIIAVSLAALYISSIGTWNLENEYSTLTSDIGKIVTAVSSGEPDNSEVSVNSVGSGRGRLWINAIQFAGERPVFGYGPDNLGERYAEVGISMDRPHCEPLQFAASLGIPAALFYISAMLSHLLMFIRNFRKVDMRMLCSYCIVLSYLVSSMFGNTMFYTTPFFFMLLAMSRAAILPCEEILPVENRADLEVEADANAEARA